MEKHEIGAFNTFDFISNKTCYKACGYTDDDLGRPIIGIANSFNEMVSGHMNLRSLAEQVKYGVYRRGRHTGRVRHHRLLRRHHRQPRGSALRPALPREHSRRH